MNRHLIRWAAAWGVAVLTLSGSALSDTTAELQKKENSQLALTAQRGRQRQQGQRGRPGLGGPGGQNEQRADMDTIHRLFADNKKITRTIRDLPNGVETRTESDDPKVTRLLQEHTAAMHARLKEKRPIRMWDPLFAEIFRHADKIQMRVTNTPKGVQIQETSRDAYTVQLIQSHARAVSDFVKEGTPGMHKSHPAPASSDKNQTKEAASLGKGDGITTCPVTGEPVDKNITADINGRSVAFCCAGCVETVKENPARYLKPVQTDPDYTRKTSHAHADVLTAIQEAAKTNGFTVTSLHDLAASLKKAGIEREPYVVVEICKPEIASAILNAEPRLGALMPCRLTVYQQGKVTVVSTILPSRLIALFPDAKVRDAAAAVDVVMKRIIDAATSAE